ncbi:MAG: aquaporin family protein [Acidobacteria bacterium]|nr:aquaporin family protein [Acidobacteriota bacterium]
MHGPLLGEFMGTLVLVLLGDGVVANVLLKKSKGENSGWIVISTGWAMAVVAGIFTAIAFGSPGAHINPAVTLAVAITSGSWSNVGTFWIAQFLGAFAGACLVWLTYLAHWKETPDADAKLGIFSTGPAIRNLPANLLTEIIATTFLIVVGFSFGSKAVSTTGLSAGFGPWLWGVLVWSLGLSLGGPTGYAMNPARDLGPRVAHTLLPISNKGGSDWGYALVPIVGPLIAGGLGAVIIRIAGVN